MASGGRERNVVWLRDVQADSHTVTWSLCTPSPQQLAQGSIWDDCVSNQVLLVLVQSYRSYLFWDTPPQRPLPLQLPHNLTAALP